MAEAKKINPEQLKQVQELQGKLNQVLANIDNKLSNISKCYNILRKMYKTKEKCFLCWFPPGGHRSISTEVGGIISRGAIISIVDIMGII